MFEQALSLTSRSMPRPQPLAALGTFSPKLSREPHAKALFGVDDIVLRPSTFDASRLTFVVGWGQKDTATPARAYATRHSITYLRAEDGFVRSLGLGVLGEPACSVVLDDLGIYYDATRPSRLETWLNAPWFHISEPELSRATACMELIRRHRISKYNHACAPLDWPPRSRPRVLVVDQTAGDLSVRLGGVAPNGFAHMLDAARSEHPDAEIVIKVHPDVMAGKKQGFLEHTIADERVRVLGRAVNPLALLEQVDHVYVATSQLGFEALLLGKPVTCFGVPFYAGWGLTHDRVHVPRRIRKRTVEQVFAAAYLRYARYVDPRTGARATLEDLLTSIAHNRRARVGAGARVANDVRRAAHGTAPHGV